MEQGSYLRKVMISSTARFKRAVSVTSPGVGLTCSAAMFAIGSRKNP